MRDCNLTPIASAVHCESLHSASRNNALRTGHTIAKQTHGFTLAELVVTVGVLVLLVFLVTQLLNSAATVTTLAHKQMDADAQTRQLLDRMALDFAQMVKRSDVDYYVKSSWFVFGSPPTPAGVTGVRTLLQPGNDVIAFYSNVPGYYPTPSYQSPISLVAYRVYKPSTTPSPCPNCNKLERMGKGLLWNAATPSPAPVVFMPVPLASPIPIAELPQPAPSPTASPAWPEVASNTNTWSDSEIIGSQVFRFEYYYLLKGQTNPATGTNYSPIFSDTPWDTRICSCPAASPPPTPTPTGTPIPSPTPEALCCHTAPEGMQDVAAVVVVIAVIDPKSKVLLSDSTTPSQIAQVASQLIDWGDTTCPGCPSQTQWQTTPGLLRAQWQNTLNRITNLPRPAISGIRVYERYLYLSPPTLLTP
jgi:type II secretory pathway pseudopilin PulG